MNGNHIKSVRIENFANHKDTFVTLELGVNIITGTSDSGKTAFVRALMFVLDNMSSGTSYVNKLTKAKFAKVTIEFSDGRIISRTKGESVNKVEFKHPEDEKFTVYSNFSSKYPEAVNTFLLNLPKDEENKALYYAKQSKKLFLIDQTSQSMPKTLSQLLNIGDLEEVGKNLGSEVHAIEKSFKSKSKDYDQLKSDIDEKYADLENDLLHKINLEELLNNCILIEQDCKQISKYIDKLQRLKDSNREISNTINECDKIINSVSDHLDDLETLEDKFKNLSSYIKIVNKYNNNKSALEIEISKATAICDDNFVKSISDIELLKDKLNDLKKFIDFFSDQQTLIDTKNNEISNLASKIDTDKQEYERIKTILIDEKIVCDICNKFGGELI